MKFLFYNPPHNSNRKVDGLLNAIVHYADQCIDYYTKLENLYKKHYCNY